MTPKIPRVKKMPSTGHYRVPRMQLPGAMNMPGRGRVGKMMPSFKKFTKPGKG